MRQLQQKPQQLQRFEYPLSMTRNPVWYIRRFKEGHILITQFDAHRRQCIVHLWNLACTDNRAGDAGFV